MILRGNYLCENLIEILEAKCFMEAFPSKLAQGVLIRDSNGYPELSYKIPESRKLMQLSASALLVIRAMLSCLFVLT